MAHESFEGIEVAELLNRDFICIKVDREERPDVDSVYMSVCQMLTGFGGWPLTILMTPDQKPFWAGTYLTKYTRYERIGLVDLLKAVAQQWKTNRKSMLAAGEEIVQMLQPQKKNSRHTKPTKDLLAEAIKVYQRSYDNRWGGFGHAPKFPAPHNLKFLLMYAMLEKDKQAQEMAEHTLIQMYRGGIFDHIGGGFSRYSTDEKWQIPHFEKMLYDNALLADVYLEAFHITNRTFYSTVARRILNYVKEELMDDLGAPKKARCLYIIR